MLLRFPGAPSVSPTDASRLLAELTWGRHVFGALPWVSIESTHDRGAARVSADARARLDVFRISTYIPPPYIFHLPIVFPIHRWSRCTQRFGAP